VFAFATLAMRAALEEAPSRRMNPRLPAATLRQSRSKDRDGACAQEAHVKKVERPRFSSSKPKYGNGASVRCCRRIRLGALRYAQGRLRRTDPGATCRLAAGAASGSSVIPRFYFFFFLNPPRRARGSRYAPTHCNVNGSAIDRHRDHRTARRAWTLRAADLHRFTGRVLELKDSRISSPEPCRSRACHPAKKTMP